MKNRKNKIAAIVVLVIIGIVSFTLIAPLAQNPEAKINSETIKVLDEKEADLMKLTAATAGASIAVSAIPGDATTPVAEKFADISSYFVVILCIVFIEKYLVAIIGMLSFKVIIPIACGLGILYLLCAKKIFKIYALKMGIFALILYLMIPSSVMLGNVIEDTHEEIIQNSIIAAETAVEEVPQDEGDEKSFFAKITENITEGASGVTEKFTALIKNFIETLAVMIITTCVIPILVIFGFILLVKLLFGVDVSGGKKVSSLFQIRNKVKEQKAKKGTGQTGGNNAGAD